MPVLCFITPSGDTARLGTFHPIHPEDLRFFVHRFPLHWIEIQ